jgi:hypothetical protein
MKCTASEGGGRGSGRLPPSVRLQISFSLTFLSLIVFSSLASRTQVAFGVGIVNLTLCCMSLDGLRDYKSKVHLTSPTEPASDAWKVLETTNS